MTVCTTGSDGRDSPVVDLLPPPWNARTRVHEYGGTAWLPVPAEPSLTPSPAHDLVFVHFADSPLATTRDR